MGQIIDIYSTNQILQSDMQFESTGWKKLPFFSDGSKEFQQLKDTRIAKATKQYVFDEQGVKYLDCFNGVAHVGHCHPQVVAAASTQMGRVATSQGFKSTLLQHYVKRLAQTLPESLDTVYVCNSGSEANDLALRTLMQFHSSYLGIFVRYLFVLEVFDWLRWVNGCEELSIYAFNGN